MLPLLYSGLAAASINKSKVKDVQNRKKSILKGAVLGTVVAGPVGGVIGGLLGTVIDAGLGDYQNDHPKYPKTDDELAGVLQRHITDIRVIAGLSAEFFSPYVGVTKQAIGHLENCRIKMTPLQHTAWCAIFDTIGKAQKDNKPLQKVINFILYGLNDYSDDEIKRYEEVIHSIAKAKKAGVDNEILDLVAANLPDVQVSYGLNEFSYKDFRLCEYAIRKVNQARKKGLTNIKIDFSSADLADEKNPIYDCIIQKINKAQKNGLDYIEINLDDLKY